MTDRKLMEGKCILVVEDDFLIAMALTDDMLDHGATVIGPLPSCAETLSVVNSGSYFDAAIFDINLRDGQVYEAADLLMRLERPFIFASSESRALIPRRFEFVPIFSKPLDVSSAVEFLREYIDQPRNSHPA